MKRSYAAYAGLAYGLAKTAYKDRNMYKYYYSKFGKRKRVKRTRFAKKKRAYRSKLKNVGFRVGTGVAKRRQTHDNPVPQLMRDCRLNIRSCTRIEKYQGGVGTSDIDHRQRDIINYRGWEMNMELRNQTTQPVWFCWALLHPTERSQTPLTDTSLGTNFDTFARDQQEDFFRNNGLERGLDFYDATFGTLDTTMRSINADEYHVLKRGHILIPGTPTGDAYNLNGPKNYVRIKKYFPIKRQLRYSGPNDEDCDDPFFLVYWIVRTLATPPMSQASQSLSITERHVAYFREPKN